ncbi:DUF5017 domain-containing protein [Desertivirga brevis]|uniref:DUF5017 domain-containing protein n=1 Tax=Desertivirga brevis TaxID=2810310 RepID=UPI001A95E5FC|nr:DUF5017 domain-containing protein [Pedobacter sp. SYSU D00873]
MMLKNIKIILVGSIASLILSSCDKDLSTPEFEVSTRSTTFKKGELITFNISGNPDVIRFYSGEQGKKYEFSRRDSLKGKLLLQFSTFAQNSGSQENSLKILYSTDFKGAYNIAGVQAATWNDVTSKAILSNGTDNVPSGQIDLTNIVPATGPVYFAFRKRDEQSATQKPRAWTIRSFQLNLLNEQDNFSYPLTDLTNAGWTAVDVLNSTYRWAINLTATSPALSIGGGNINTAANEDWVITKVLYPNAIKPDPAIPVKGVDTKVESYSYSFATPGVYKLAFVASNMTPDKQKEVVKELELTITD